MELRSAPLPSAGVYLWDVFMRLHSRRSSNGFGLSPITWGDLDAFIRLTGIRLAPWEVEAIEDLDRAFMTEQARQSRDQMEKVKHANG